MFDFIKNLFGVSAEKSPLSALFTEVNMLGRKQMAMPIEFIGLSSRLAESAEGTDRQLVIDTLLKDYIAHKSMYVRRAAAIAFRKMDDLDSPEVNEAMFQRLSDENDWVIYDAAWFFEKNKSASGKILEKLKEIAGDAVKYDKDELEIPFDSISDAHLQAQYQAAKAVLVN